ncbi:MAG: type II secretion system minor pseudopilin GspI [Bermanella sp.]
MKNKQSGFTLLEVMIAITIFAMLATTVSQVASVTVDNQIHLEKKMLAAWIAENKLIEMRFLPWNDIKKGTDEVKMSNREWLINTTVSIKKDFGGIPMEAKEVTVAVSLKSEPDSVLQSFVSFLANDDV